MDIWWARGVKYTSKDSMNVWVDVQVNTKINEKLVNACEVLLCYLLSQCLPLPSGSTPRKNWEFKSYRPNWQIPVLQVFPSRVSSSSTSLLLMPRFLWQLECSNIPAQAQSCTTSKRPGRSPHFRLLYSHTGNLKTHRVFLRVSAGYWLRSVRVGHIPSPRTRIPTFPAVDVFLNDDDRAGDDSEPWRCKHRTWVWGVTAGWFLTVPQCSICSE